MANKALSFDGTDDKVDFGDPSSALDPGTGGFTVEYWIYPRAKTADYIGHIFLNAAESARFQTVFSGGNLQIYTQDGAWHDTGKTLTLDEWSYVVWSKAGETLKLYINGQDTGWSMAHTASLGPFTDLKFGHHVNYLNGVLDEIRISHKGRTQAEVTAIWNNGNGVQFEVDADTVALWHLNEGTGGTAYDETNNNYDGAITGATWVDGYPFLPIEKTSSDTGSGVETLGSRLFGAAETGAGISASWLLAALIGTEETGLGSEFAAKILSALDSGSGTEAHIARLLAAAEIGSAIEAALLVKHLLASDYGLGGDAIATLLALIIGNEVGSGWERFEAKIVTFPGVFDMRLPTSAGEVRIPSKGVNL